MPSLLILIVGLPLLAAVVTAVFGSKLLGRHAHWPAILGIAGSCLCSLALIAQVSDKQSHSAGPSQAGYAETITLWNWADIGHAYDQAPKAIAPGADVLAPGADVLVTPGGMRRFTIDITLRADALTAMMLGMLTFVATLVTIYGAGYMHGDRGYWRFFAYVSLFVFSMTMLVSASNFLLLYVFWEAVGVCSYLLIGFWYEKPEAAAAGKKAFLVNRVGDFGFALALFLIWVTYGTLNFHDTANVAGVLGQTRLLGELGFVGGGVGFAICILLLVGACGKSAQFPLHVWLPDAMEGPTPVSALIHAATMVTAGVYMIARCMPLFLAAPDALLIVSVIGGITMLLAALIALTQYDLKRVLAYSTISQLGYMFLAMGVGTTAAATAGVFHLFTHAFFKALLFLGAGSVMHSMGHVIDMRRFGGLRRVMPITHFTFAIGCLALAGVFPFAGFWSKDAIVAAVHDKVHILEHQGMERHGNAHDAADPEQHAAGRAAADVASAVVTPSVTPVFGLTPSSRARVYQTLYGVAIFTALLTAFYTFRAFFMTFYGPLRTPHEAGPHPHESPRSMTWPLLGLAFGAATFGVLFEGGGWSPLFAKFVQGSPSFAYGFAEYKEFHPDVAMASTVVVLMGIALAAYMYLGHQREVDWIAGLLQFRWLSSLQNLEWVNRAEQHRWLVATKKLAGQLALGWLYGLARGLVVLLATVAIAPLMLVHNLSPYQLSSRKFFFDEIYNAVIVAPLRLLATLSYWVDRYLVDGLVDTCGRFPFGVGRFFRGLQIGLVQFYALAMALGALVLIAVLWLGAAG